MKETVKELPTEPVVGHVCHTAHTLLTTAAKPIENSLVITTASRTCRHIDLQSHAGSEPCELLTF